jgi:hypothetical protein
MAMSKIQHTVVSGKVQETSGVDVIPLVPATVHGHPIIATYTTPAGAGTRAGRVILVDLGPGRVRDRYVTGWQGQDGNRFDDGWSSGNYIDDLFDALTDFVARARNGF